MKLYEDARASGELNILSFDPKVITCYEDYLRLVSPQRLIDDELERELLISGKAAQILRQKNLIVNAGKSQVVNLLTGNSTAFFNFVGVGSSNTAVTASDTDLNAIIGSRLTVSAGYLVSPNVAKWDTYFGPSASNGTWFEAGLFTALTGGTMGSHALVNPGSGYVKSSSASAVLNWTWTF